MSVVVLAVILTEAPRTTHLVNMHACQVWENTHRAHLVTPFGPPTAARDSSLAHTWAGALSRNLGDSTDDQVEVVVGIETGCGQRVRAPVAADSDAAEAIQVVTRVHKTLVWNAPGTSNDCGTRCATTSPPHWRRSPSRPGPAPWNSRPRPRPWEGAVTHESGELD
ncbi:hypothetical protein ACQEU6_24730 [Spirillospora sp. CA-108201]